MIDDDDLGVRARCVTPWRRGFEMLDDYDDGVLSEELADDLAGELAGLGPRSRARFARAAGDGSVLRRACVPAGLPARVPARPRLVLLPGGKA